MTYYPDLSCYQYQPIEYQMYNVGWLEAAHDFPVGEVNRDLMEALLLLAEVQDNIMRGVHDCDFCSEESPIRIPAPVKKGYVSLGMGELHVEGCKGERYAAPSLVVHYISAHQYVPPASFCEAVLCTAARRRG